MRTLVASILTFALGCAAGWYFGYTRPLARNSHRVAEITGWTPLESARAFEAPDKTFRELLGSNEQAVALASVVTLSFLEHGDIERAKDYLAQRIAGYYVAEHALDTPSVARDKFRHRIEELSEISPALKHKISDIK